MGSPDAYRESLRDSRRVFYDGQVVEDVTVHARFIAAVDAVARGFEDSGTDGDIFEFPRSANDLRERLSRLERWEVMRITTLESLLTLQTVASRMRDQHPELVRRISTYVQYSRDNDLRCVQAITDAKGDRSKSPAEQSDPDLYLRIVERQRDGIVINGAKLHISGAAIANELVVIPTKRMKAGEEDWAVACAVPVDSPGITILNTCPGPDPCAAPAYYPHSSFHAIPEGFVVFDHVFVPNDRVFLDGQTRYSADFAHSLGLWQRLGGVAQMAREADMLTGFAQLLAEANGLANIPHIKDKIRDLIVYATIIRSGLEAAVSNATITDEGFAIPDEVYTNVAKYYGAAELSTMIRNLHDIGGGSVLTAPQPGDIANPEVRPYVEKYMVGADVNGDSRTELFHAVRDLTADRYGGWWQVASLMSGGGLFAQKLVAAKHYDMDRAKALATEVMHRWRAEGTGS